MFYSIFMNLFEQKYQLTIFLARFDSSFRIKEESLYFWESTDVALLQKRIHPLITQDLIIVHIISMIWTTGVPSYSLQGFTYHEDKHTDHHFLPHPNTPYKLVSVLDISKVAEISANLFHSHQLVLNDFNGHKNQRFHIRTDHGLCLFECLSGQGSLHVVSESSADGAHIKAGELNQHGSFYFQIVPITEGIWTGKGCYIRTFCGKALEVNKSHTDNNTAIIQEHFTGAANQIWIIRPADDETHNHPHKTEQLGENPYITNSQSQNSSVHSQHQPAHQSAHHLFPQAGMPYRISPSWDQSSTLIPHHNSHQLHVQKIINHSDQFITFDIIDQHSGKVVIHINGAQTVYHIPHNHSHDGAYLTAAHPKFEESQYWHLEKLTGGKHAADGWHIRSFCGKYLDVEEGGNIGEGTAVVQWQKTNSGNQIWLIHPYNH